MAFQFPAGPAVDQTFTPVAGVTYRWSGTAWHLLAGPGAFITTADADTRYVNVDEAQNTTNRIINGKFAIDQRNAGAAQNITTVTTANVSAYGLDRWEGFAQVFTGTTAFTFQRQAHGVRAGEFRLGVTVVTPITPTTGDSVFIHTKIEGSNIADLNFGAAGASPFTIGFEVLSSVTGTFPVSFRNFNATRSYVTTFAATAGVLTQVSVTVPGDVTGTWDKTTGVAVHVGFVLGAGPTNMTATPNTWVAANVVSATGCTNLIATAGATYSISNVRLYRGSVDFGPDRRLYAEELALCQRYFCKSYGINVVPGTASGNGTINQLSASNNNWLSYVSFPTRMRAVPTVTVYSSTSGASGVIRNDITGVDVAATPVPSESGVVFAATLAGPAQQTSHQYTASSEL